MTTITIKNGQKITRTTFKDVEDIQEYLFSIYSEDVELGTLHKDLLDERLKEMEENPANFVSFNELKADLARNFQK